jgi:hypothetical protein
MSGVPPVATAPVAAVVVLAQRAGGGPVVRNYPLDHPPTLVHVRRGDMGPGRAPAGQPRRRRLSRAYPRTPAATHGAATMIGSSGWWTVSARPRP